MSGITHSRWRGALLTRLGFALTTLTGLVLGYVGLMKAHQDKASLTDLVYWDLQLFTLDCDGLENVELNTELQFARFLVPLATFYAIAEVAVYLFSERVRGWNVRRRWSGHTVVWGESTQAVLLVERLLERGERVVFVGDGETGRATGRYFSVEGGTPTPGVLRAAGVSRAAAVYAFSDDTSANMSTAMAIVSVQRGDRPPIKSYVWVPDPELCHALRARRLGLENEEAARVEFVNPAQLAARELAAERDREQLGHVLVVGLGAFARSLVVELARRQRELHGPGRARLTLVGADAPRMWRTLLAAHPVLAHWDARPLDVPTTEFNLRAWSGRLASGELPDQTYLCDPDTALRGALTAVPLWHGRPRSLVVCLEQSLTYDGLFQSDALLDGLRGALGVFGVTESACRAEFDDHDLVEQLARSIHRRYLGFGTRTASDVTWDELPETFRHASRAQVAHIGEKLLRANLLIAPIFEVPRPFEFSDSQIEELAALEHDRWRNERLRAGWRHGAHRDDTARTHPGMVDWPRLPEPEREKDREFVRALPGLLAAVDLRLIAPD